MTADSQSYLADVVSGYFSGYHTSLWLIVLSQHPGDLWYFPPGLPHSIQALNDTGADGSEFLLVSLLSLTLGYPFVGGR